MKKRQVMLHVVLILFLIMFVTVPNDFAAENNIIEVSNTEEFTNAITSANNASSGSFVIKLMNDIEINGATINSTNPTTILGNGHTLTISQYNCIQVMSGAQLTLGSPDGDILNIKSNGLINNDVPGMLYIKGSCNMYQGATISDREGSNYFGGGVTISGGTFHMYGGTIKNCGIRGGSVCYGGGVAVVYGGTFIMDDGEIKNCYAETDTKPKYGFTAMGGAVFVSGGSSFIMNGGTLSDNTATNMGGGVAITAPYEEIKSGFGNIMSSVEILGGTIKNNSANTGAGVFASAYHYVYASGICDQEPSIGKSQKQGLIIKNANIINNNADETDGNGGGIYVAMLKFPAIAEISDTVIEKNSAAVGAGVMSYAYYTNMNIFGCTISENKAKSVGGGFAAESNTQGGKTTMSNTVLCNNVAEEAASDIYLNYAPLVLMDAKDMDSIYLGKPDDVNNKKIDGWYIDNEDSRYTAQSKEMRKEYENYTNIPENEEICLIAAARPSFAKITFTNDDNSTIYGEDWYPIGTKAEDINLPVATKESDETYDYTFDSWNKKIQNVTGDAVYIANFKKTFKKFNAMYSFESATENKELPDEVKSLLPNDTTNYILNDNILAITPKQTVVETADGKWTFKGFNSESILANMLNSDDKGNVNFIGSWEYTPKTNSLDSGNSEKLENTENTKIDNESNIDTGDNSNIAL